MAAVLFDRVIAPAWEATPPEVKALFDLVCRDFDSVVFSNDPSVLVLTDAVKADLFCLSTSVMAASALAMSRYGYHHPDRSFCERGHGGWRKLVHVLDHGCMVRHGLIEGYQDAQGMAISVCEGLLRLEFAMRSRYGCYVTCGLAMDGNMAKIRADTWPAYPGKDAHPQDQVNWFNACRAQAKEIAKSQRTTTGKLAPLFDYGLIHGFKKKG